MGPAPSGFYYSGEHLLQTKLHGRMAAGDAEPFDDSMQDLQRLGGVRLSYQFALPPIKES